MGLRLLAWTLAAAAPGILGLLVLIGTGQLGAGAAALAACFVLAATAVIVWPVLAGISAIRHAAQAAEEDDAAPAVRSLSPTIEELWLAIARLLRTGRQKRRDLEAELAATRAILAAIPAPLLLLDEQRRIRSVNDAATARFGAGIAGHDLAMALRHPALLEAADEALAAGKSRVVELTHDDRQFAASVAPTERRRGEGIAAVIALSDVTALKRSDAMRADFVANASHELRTPLATLVGFIETLQGPARDDPEAREKFLAIMHGQGSRMARLVDDLLSLSRIEMREHVLPTERVALQHVLGSVADTLQLRAQARGMRIELDIPGDLPPALGDREELAQLFQNLIDNAIKYGRGGTPIHVTASPASRVPPGMRGGAALAVAVRDEGEGIARDHLPRLTERFYRVDAARSREVGGTGLGLAIVKHILQRHRGVLEIESEPGRGSTFTAYLPAA